MRNLAMQRLKAIKSKQILVFLVLLFCAFAIDRWVKDIMLNGFSWDSEAITIGGYALVYNKGVAFSMFSFLASYLKYVQILFLLIIMILAFFSDFFIKHYVPLGILFGAGISNILDRFIYDGVVDYVFWHYGFDFAIFNVADVLIDISVAVIIVQILLSRKKEHRTKD